MTTTAQAAADQEERIVRLFAEGYGIDFVCERGLVAGINGWNRARVLEVVSRRGWTLDGTGRLPRQDRPAITPGKPAPRQASGKTQIGVIGGGPAVVPAPRPSPGRSQVAALLGAEVSQTSTEPANALDPRPAPARRAQSLIERVEVSIAAGTPAPVSGGPVGPEAEQLAAQTASGTPTEKGPEPTTSEPVGTAPESAPVTGRRAPDAAPQVSPSRTRTEDGGGRGASDAVAAPPVATPATVVTVEGRPLVDVVTDETMQAELAAECATLLLGDDDDVEPPILMAPAADTADQLLQRATGHTDPGIRDHARRATLLLEQIRAALARDGQRAHLRARLAELDAERDALLARLAEPLLPAVIPSADEVAADQAARVTAALQPDGAAEDLAAGLQQATAEVAAQLAAADWPDTTGSCGTWGGFLKHRYRGDTVAQIEADCPPCYAAKATRGRKAAS